MGPRVKTIEYRSRPTRLIGQRFYIYAAKKWARTPINGDLTLSPALSLPRMERESMPTGVIVGTAVITKCVQSNGHYEWHLSKVKRLPNPRGRNPKGRPQPVWFNPF